MKRPRKSQTCQLSCLKLPKLSRATHLHVSCYTIKRKPICLRLWEAELLQLTTKDTSYRRSWLSHLVTKEEGARPSLLYPSSTISQPLPPMYTEITFYLYKYTNRCGGCTCLANRRNERPQILTSSLPGASGGAVAATANSLMGVVVSLKTSDTSWVIASCIRAFRSLKTLFTNKNYQKCPKSTSANVLTSVTHSSIHSIFHSVSLHYQLCAKYWASLDQV